MQATYLKMSKVFNNNDKLVFPFGKTIEITVNTGYQGLGDPIPAISIKDIPENEYFTCANCKCHNYYHTFKEKNVLPTDAYDSIVCLNCRYSKPINYTD